MTITDSPAANIAGHNPIMYVLSSVNSGEAAYQYILDVYIGGVLRARLKENGTGVMDVTRVVQSYIPQNYFVASASAPVLIIPYIDFTVKAGEKYITTLGVPVETFDIVTSSSRAYNAALPAYEAAVNFGSNHPFLNKFQTNRSPLIWQRLELGENCYLSAFADPSSEYDELEVTYYQYENGGGSVVSVDSSAVSGCFIYNLGANIDALALSCVAKLKRAGVQVGSDLNFNFNECTPYETVPLHFMNALGGFESVHFRYKSKRKINVERKSAAQVMYTKVSGAISFSENKVFNEQKFNYYNQYREEKNISTDVLDDTEVDWLLDLIISPLVYTEKVINGQTYFIPVTVKADSYEIKRAINGKPEALSIDIEYSALNNTQLR